MTQDTVKLLFHEQTLELLGHTPTVSPTALAVIEKCEAECGRKLPAAVREWFAISGIERVLNELDDDLRAATLDEFLQPFVNLDVQGEDRVHFYGDWGTWDEEYYMDVVLDGSDDPYVIDLHCDRFFFGRDPRFTKWAQSKIFLHRIFDKPYAASQDPVDSKTYIGEFGPPHLDYLVETFSELLRTQNSFDGQEYVMFRFYQKGQRLAVTTIGGNPTTQVFQAKYQLSADNFDLLLGLYEAAWPVHGVPMRLSGVADMDFDDVKKAFRSRFPNAVLHPDRYGSG